MMTKVTVEHPKSCLGIAAVKAHMDCMWSK